MISRRNSRFIWKAHFHLIGCRFDEILWSILFVYWGISMTPLMMSALTSHTTLKHNYYYTTQHLHCDITDISKLHATLILVHFRLDGPQCWLHYDHILTTFWLQFDHILTTFWLHATLMLVHFRLDGPQCGGGRYSCRGCHRWYGLTTVTTANKGQ